MNKSELVEAVAGQVGDRRTAAAAVEAVLGTVMRAVRDGEPVALSGFGVFEKVDRAARSARNPSTGAAVAVPATSAPRFRPGQVFKDVVSGHRELPVPASPVPRTASPVTRSAPPVASTAPPVVADEPVVQEVTETPLVDEQPAAKKADAKKADAKKADAKKARSKDSKKAGKKAGKK